MSHKSDKTKKSSLTAAQVLRFHWNRAMRFPKQVAVSFIVGPTTIVLERYVTPLIIAALLLEIQNGTVTLESSFWMIILFAALQIFNQVIGYRFNLYAMWDVQVKGARAIYKESYDKLTHHSLGFYADNFAGSLVSKVNKFAAAFISYWNVIVFQVMFISVSIIATLVGLSFLIWQYAIILAVLITIFIIASFYGNRFLRPRQKARSESYTKISAQLSDSISNMFAVKIDSKERSERKRLNQALDSMVEKEFAVRSGIMRVSTINSALIAIMRISALVASIWAVQEGIGNAAVIYLALTFTFNVIQEIWNISQMFRAFYQLIGDSEEMLELLNTPIEVPDYSTKQLKPGDGEIIVSSMAFRHDDNKPLLFNDFHLTIPAGQKVGIIGVSGSGKTTITKLLMRFMDPEAGAITINGQDIKQVTQQSLHEAIAYVPQEPLLFHRTIEENIGYSNSKATKKDIEKAAAQAHALEFIQELPDGFDTLVGERGVKLSGGQRQRVAIARAILKDAPILILDEATSALDSESERLIQIALEELMKDRTSIVIAHRLSTIAKLDRIIVLEKGEIIEDGTHTSLLEQKGTYAKLWAHQSGGFIEE